MRLGARVRSGCVQAGGRFRKWFRASDGLGFRASGLGVV